MDTAIVNDWTKGTSWQSTAEEDFRLVGRIRDFLPGRSDSASSETYMQAIAHKARVFEHAQKFGFAEAALLAYAISSGTGMLSASFQTHRVDKTVTASIQDQVATVTPDWSHFEPEENSVLAEQPRFAYSEVLSYAKAMGLPTDFPV